HDGKADGSREVCNRLLLLEPNLVEFLISDQGVGSGPEGMLNRFFLGEQGLLILGFGETQVSGERATGENRLADTGTVGPHSTLRTHHARERTASPEGSAAGAGEGYLRKERRFRHSNLGVCGNKSLFSLANIGAPLQQRGRKSCWHGRRNWLVGEVDTWREASRVISGKNTGRVS